MDDLVNRFAYHPPSSDDVRIAHERVRAELLNVAQSLTALLPEGREQSLFVTKLEEAMFWANAAIARAPSNVSA